jgi:hypothetical protein
MAEVNWVVASIIEFNLHGSNFDLLLSLPNILILPYFEGIYYLPLSCNILVDMLLTLCA